MNLVMEASGDGAVLRVKAQPGARKEGLTGLHDGAVKVAVSAAPEKGKANKAIIKLLAKVLNVPRKDIEILTGATSPLKRVAIRTLTPEVVKDRLERQLKGTS